MPTTTATPLLLLVDDNPRNLDALKVLFEGQGYRLAFAHNGPEALEKSVTLNPDLVLLDVLMPEMDGYDVCQRIRETPAIAELPVVMVTALTDTEARIRGFEAGADDFVSKPIDPLELRTRVRSITRLNRYRRLEAERNRQEQLVKLAPCGWLVCDDKGIIRSSNDRMTELLKMTPGSDLVGIPLPALFAHSERFRIAEWLDAMPATTRLESRLACVGSLDEPWVDIVGGAFKQGALNWYQILVTDITERKNLEQVQKEEYFRKLTHGTADLVATICPKGAYCYVSPAAGQVLGVRAEEMVGKDLLSGVHPEDQKHVRDALHEVCQQNGAIVHLDYRHRHEDGGWRNLRTSMRNAIQDDHVGAIVLNARDMTEHQELWNQLLHVQKMDAIGQLAGGVAHDFNNLLSVVMICTQLTLKQMPEDSPLRENIMAIERSAQRGAGLTRQLLTFSRKQTTDHQQVDMSSLVAELETMLRPLISEDIGLRIVPSHTPLFVNADPGQLEQMVLNLVVNARDAVESGGQIELHVDKVWLDKERVDATSATLLPGHYARLIVRDDGCGMDASTLSHIFEPFFTTKPPDQGTGLGLSTIFGIIKENQGGVFVDSSPGEGTSFEVWWPQIHREAVDEPVLAPPPKIAQTFESTGEPIVLLEDDPAVLDVVKRLLDAMGYDVFATDKPDLAIARCTNPDEGVVLLITDLMMPGLSGFDVLQEVRSLRHDLPCICMSGYHDKFAKELHDMQRLWLLQKPFSSDNLARTIREALTCKDIRAINV